MNNRTHKTKAVRRPHRPLRGSRDIAQQHRIAHARLLDRLADAELRHGHHAPGERLSHQAGGLGRVKP